MYCSLSSHIALATGVGKAGSTINALCYATVQLYLQNAYAMNVVISNHQAHTQRTEIVVYTVVMCVCATTCSSSSTTKTTADGSTLVHDGRLPLPQQLQQFISPKVYGDSVLQGHKFAWGKTTIPPQETLFVADPVTARNWLSNEHTLGIATDWLENISELRGVL